jgi:hypothetical protein
MRDFGLRLVTHRDPLTPEYLYCSILDTTFPVARNQDGAPFIRLQPATVNGAPTLALGLPYTGGEYYDALLDNCTSITVIPELAVRVDRDTHTPVVTATGTCTADGHGSLILSACADMPNALTGYALLPHPTYPPAPAAATCFMLRAHSADADTEAIDAEITAYAPTLELNMQAHLDGQAFTGTLDLDLGPPTASHLPPLSRRAARVLGDFRALTDIASAISTACSFPPTTLVELALVIAACRGTCQTALMWFGSVRILSCPSHAFFPCYKRHSGIFSNSECKICRSDC